MSTKTESKKIEKKELTVSERFTQMIMREFANVSGNGVKLSPSKKQLTQHLFIAIDSKLHEYELRRIEKNQKDKLPIVWANVNMQKLAKDAIHRINLGLDAFIENHIQIIPFYIKSDKKYTIDLGIGFVGKDYYRRKMAIDPPKNVIYELVYKNDKFKPVKKDINNKIEAYIFEIAEDAFNRGETVGGFGYIEYEDPTKNKLVLISEKEFKKAESCAPTDVFWKKWPENMKYKTTVLRTTAKIQPDPEKINESYMIVENDDQEKRILAEIEENANKKVIDIKTEEKDEAQGNEPEENETEEQGSNKPPNEKSETKAPF